MKIKSPITWLNMKRKFVGAAMANIGFLTTSVVEEAARIVIELRNEQPVDLLEFTTSLTAFAREHKAFLKKESPSLTIEESRLLIVEIRKGSTILELVPQLAPFIAIPEVTNTVVEFVSHMKSAFSYITIPKGRLPDPTTQQLKNMADTVRSIIADAEGSSLKVAARYKNGRTLQEFVVDRSEARLASENAIAQLVEIEDKHGSVFKKVLMRLHQSSVENVKIGAKTSEKGIVERITEKPLPLVYVSDDAGRKIKQEIMEPEGNPFQKGFIVDLDVETINSKPRIYRIIEVHEIVDLED